MTSKIESLPTRSRRSRTATTSPRRALRTVPAADYLGLSPSLLRKYRSRGVDDPQDKGPEFIKVSPSIVLYEITALDAWLDSRRAASPSQAA